MRAEIAAESSGAGPKRRQHWRSTDERCADREINWESKKRAGSREHSRQRLDEATRDDTERADRQMKSGGEKSRALGDSWAGGKTKIDLRCPKAQAGINRSLRWMGSRWIDQAQGTKLTWAVANHNFFHGKTERHTWLRFGTREPASATGPHPEEQIELTKNRGRRTGLPNWEWQPSLSSKLANIHQE
jgi:hypothetical protein